MEFRYFDGVLRNAEFTDEPCNSCGSEKNCLEGVYFDKDDEVESVCLKCLKEGLITVDISDYVRNKITQHLQSTFSGTDQAKMNEMVNKRIKELERTPPVPWIQYNDWLVCCGDFMKYQGEWKKEDFTKLSPSTDGKETLFNMLEDFSQSKIESLDAFWNDIGKHTAVFVFQCSSCNERRAVSQSY